MQFLFYMVFVLIAPRDAPQIGGQPVIVSSFSTSIEDQDDGVKKNIYLACRRLNGLVLAPNAVLSFNDIVGEGSAKNGFASGRVMYRDEIRYEPGGGLCQASSTLFNALLLAGCPIVERHRHFQPVTYVPPGLDATIKYGKKDLRMKNPHAQNLYIEATVTSKSVTMAVRAAAALPSRFEIVTEEDEISTPLAGDGDTIRNGVSVEVYRQKYSGTKLMESLLLYKDFYPPVRVK